MNSKTGVNFQATLKQNHAKNGWHKRPACTPKRYYKSTDGMT
jgi:hypothetical protein